jgi:hypothetical protein
MNGRSIARTALICNASFSILCGAALALDGGPIGRALVAGAPPITGPALLALGLGLIAFGAVLIAIALRRGLNARTVLLITASDVAWVLGSLAVLGLATAAFTAAGVAAVALTALAVGVFATGQGLGAARMET